MMLMIFRLDLSCRWWFGIQEPFQQSTVNHLNYNLCGMCAAALCYSLRIYRIPNSVIARRTQSKLLIPYSRHTHTHLRKCVYSWKKRWGQIRYLNAVIHRIVYRQVASVRASTVHLGGDADSTECGEKMITVIGMVSIVPMLIAPA